MVHVFTDTLFIEWEDGSHYAQVYPKQGGLDKPIDGFSFAWEKNKPDAVDFFDALASHMRYLDVTREDFLDA